MENKNEILLKNASKKLETLLELKELAVKLGDYELGAECRRLEKELFPVTEEEISAHKRGKELDLLFRMVELQISPEVAYRIEQSILAFRKKKGNFSIEDAAKIICDSKNLFLRNPLTE